MLDSFLMYVWQYNTVVLLQVGGQLIFLHLFAFRLRTKAAEVDQITFLYTEVATMIVLISAVCFLSCV